MSDAVVRGTAMKNLSCKVLIIGGGPGGYVCGIRAGQLGLDAIVVESNRLGGACLNVGCIPSKALIHAADEFYRSIHESGTNALGISISGAKIDFSRTAEWKEGIVSKLNGGVDSLLKKSKVRTLFGVARLIDGKTCRVESDGEVYEITAEHVVIATGSESMPLPGLPFGEKIISSSDALSLTSIPESMVVVGGGYIGVELGTAFAKLGCRVTLAEAASRLLPQYDSDLVRVVTDNLRAFGVEILLGARAEAIDRDTGALSIVLGDGTRRDILADYVLVTVGRRARIHDWGCEQLGLQKNGTSLAIDGECRTSMRNVWAIGDVTGEPMLAHRGMAQGRMVAELIAGLHRAFDPVCIPAVCFSDPEIVTAGLSPDEARKKGVNVKVARFPFLANGRALTAESEQGFVRIICAEEDHRVLGIQAVGKGVAELAAAFSLALEMGCRAEDMAMTIHAHPTLGEALQEASLGILGQALHV